MKRHFLLTLGLVFCVTTCLANTISEQALELAQTGVVSMDANGEPQTTVVDENGNLKIVPTTSVPAKSNTAKAPSRSSGSLQQSGGNSVMRQGGNPMPQPAGSGLQQPAGSGLEQPGGNQVIVNAPTNNQNVQPQAGVPMMLNQGNTNLPQGSTNLPRPGAPNMSAPRPAMSQPNPPGMSQ